MANPVIGKRTRPGEDESSLDNTKGSWKTVRPNTTNKLSYSNRVTLSFALTAVMTVLVLIAVLSIVWEGQFKRYTSSNMEKLAVATADTLADQYDPYEGWNAETLSFASTGTGITRDVAIQVLNNEGEVIFDDSWAAKAHKNRGHQQSIAVTPPPSDQVVSSPIVLDDGTTVGSVRVWAFGSDALLTKTDAAFRLNSYGAIWAAAAIAVVLASFMGSMVANSLTRPIRRITRTAQAMRNGDLTARTELEGEDEIGKLGETFDGMAASLESDIKMEKRITSDVAHELRTPLMAMLATVEAMQDGIYPTDEEHLGIVADEIKRLTRLVNTMLQLSRMESGNIQANLEPTEVVGMAKALVLSQERMFAEKGLKLKFNDDTSKHECYADVDRDLIHQAIINLMSNAMRYTPEGGWVVVSVAQDRNDVLISVEDTGIGIAKEDINRVFSRFWRSDASRVRESGGLGVGLSVTKEILDKHHGFISVDSELGRGTVFTLHIPREHRQLLKD